MELDRTQLPAQLCYIVLRVDISLTALPAGGHVPQGSRQRTVEVFLFSGELMATPA